MSVAFIQVPYDSGHFNWRMGAGPLVLRESGANVVEIRLDQPTFEIDAAIQLHRKVAVAVRDARRQGRFPVVFSGNCNTAAIGIAASSDEPVGVIWFDAHGDFNIPETTPSGFLDGMALAMLTGRAWRKPLRRITEFRPVAEEHVVLVGARDLDREEATLIRDSKIRHLTPAQLNELEHAADGLLRLVGKVYLHIDLDVLDPSALRANGYAAPNGLSFEQLITAVRTIVRTVPVVACGIAAYDPTLDDPAKAKKIVGAILEELTSIA